MNEGVDHSEPALDYDKIPAPVVQSTVLEWVEYRDVPHLDVSDIAFTIPLLQWHSSTSCSFRSTQEGLSKPGHGHSGANDHFL